MRQGIPRVISSILGLMCVLALAACDYGPALVYPVVARVQAPGAHRPVSGPYVLGPNDHVHVNVYGEAELTNDYEVDGSGFVSIPLAGRVKASGLTTAQLAHAISAKLTDGIIRDPKV